MSNSSIKILERVKHLLECWMNANCKQSPISQNHTVSITILSHHHDHNSVNGDIGMIWRKPRNGRFKCNVHASFSNTINKVGMGMCIRDSAEHHVRSKTMWFTSLCYVDIGEALGLYHAIRWIHKLQLANVDFEVDSKRVADYFNKGR